MTDFIDVQEVGNVMVMTLDDPTTRNSIGEEMATEINQDIDRAVAEVTTILWSERLRRSRCIDLSRFVDELKSR